jgi:hypothetical protein
MKIKILIILLFIPLINNAQVLYNGINYQAIARDASNSVLANKDLIVEIDIYNSQNSVTPEWSETHLITTNNFGLFNLIIGTGSSTGKGFAIDFPKVNWSNGIHKVISYVDFGSGMLNMGEIELQAVPYAIIADSALKAPKPIIKLSEIKDIDSKTISTNEALVWNGTTWVAGKSLKTNDFVATQSITSNNNALFKRNITVSDSVLANKIIGSSIESKDKIKANIIEAPSIIGNVTGKVTDISNHSATELKDISDVGSGKIISNNERILLNSLPTKIKSDSNTLANSINNEVSQRNTNDNLLQKQINNKQTPYISNGKIWIGNAADSAQEQVIYGDVSLSYDGETIISEASVNSNKITDNSILDADINESANISGTKINPNFGDQPIITTNNITANVFKGTLLGRANDAAQISDISGKAGKLFATDDSIFHFYSGSYEKLQFDGKTIAPLNNNYGVYVGQYAGKNSIFNTPTSCLRNVYIGYKSGFSNSFGGENVCIGYQTGAFGNTGSKNVFIGTGAGQNNNGTNNVFIGYAAGSNDFGSYKLFIGIVNYPLIYGDFANKELEINADNTVIYGSLYVTNSSSPSDKRFKKNIKTLDNSLLKLQSIRGVSYEYRVNEFPKFNFKKGTQIGFIAQEIETQFPELVDTLKGGFKVINYQAFSAILVEAVNEQQKNIEHQNADIEKLNNEIDELKKDIIEIKKAISK